MFHYDIIFQTNTTVFSDIRRLEFHQKVELYPNNRSSAATQHYTSQQQTILIKEVCSIKLSLSRDWIEIAKRKHDVERTVSEFIHIILYTCFPRRCCWLLLLANNVSLIPRNVFIATFCF